MIKNIFLIIEIILLIIFIIPVFSGIINPGNIVGIAVALLLTGITLFFDKFSSFCSNLYSHIGSRIVLLSATVIASAAVIYCIVLSGFMVNAQLKSAENAKAVVILGCKVNGETPSRMLTRRLESAYDFLIENEEVICVVSGGKGDDEKISEALAMKNYLVDKGIDDDRIIMEEYSTNTYENMKFSAQKLKSYGITDIAVVTDGFHQYRAGYIAEKCGFSVSAINAENDFYTRPLIPTYWVREWMAITKEYIFSDF